MPRVNLELVIDGDILAKDILVNDVYLFGFGTVLTKNRIEILKELGVKSVDVESRQKKYSSISEVFDNIDERFSYVKIIPIMQQIQSWMKEIITDTETPDETIN